MTVQKQSVYLSRYISGLSGLAMSLWLSPVFGATYEAGTPPTAEISHNTVETNPAPTTRTTIGIKENVTCAIYNWSDTDVRVDGESRTYVSDNYGTVAWVAAHGTCSPASGPSTTYTAPESASDTNDTVTMTADDSPLGDDSAINVNVGFTIKVPAGHAATKDSDAPYGVAGPPDNYIGAHSYFWPQVSPTSVSFKNVNFRENYPAQTNTFPNGDTTSWGPGQPTWNVAPKDGSPNVWTQQDDRQSGKYPVAKLWNGGAYQQCAFDWSVPWEFQANGTWHSISDPTMRERYTTSKTAKVSFDALYGSEQGPYQN